MSEVLQAIRTLVDEELERELAVGETVDVRTSMALIRVAHLIDSAAFGQERPAAEAITHLSTAGPLEQLRTLLRRQEWQRLSGAFTSLPGLRCPVCFNVRSRQHRADCWLRQALLLLQLAAVAPPRMHSS